MKKKLFLVSVITICLLYGCRTNPPGNPQPTPLKTEFSEEEYVWDLWEVSTNSVDMEFVPFGRKVK